MHTHSAPFFIPPATSELIGLPVNTAIDGSLCTVTLGHKVCFIKLLLACNAEAGPPAERPSVVSDHALLALSQGEGSRPWPWVTARRGHPASSLSVSSGSFCVPPGYRVEQAMLLLSGTDCRMCAEPFLTFSSQLVFGFLRVGGQPQRRAALALSGHAVRGCHVPPRTWIGGREWGPFFLSSGVRSLLFGTHVCV